MLQMRARSVVKHLIMALNMNLSTERLVRLAGQSDLSLDIHDLWRRGQSAFFSFGSETLTDGNSASQNA
jgi:hypothetical protein